MIRIKLTRAGFVSQTSGSTGKVSKHLQRPSIILEQMQQLTNVLDIINAHVEVGTGDILREVLLEQTHNDDFSEAGKLVPSETEGFRIRSVFSDFVAEWVSNFVESLSVDVRGIPGISYSHCKGQFIKWSEEGVVSMFACVVLVDSSNVDCLISLSCFPKLRNCFYSTIN